MRTKFIYLLLIAAVSGSAAAQDTLSLDDYRLRVLQYSYTLKQAAEQTRAAEAAVRGSYTGFLPQLSADGDFSINFRKRFQSDRLLKPIRFRCSRLWYSKFTSEEASAIVTDRRR